MGTFRNVFDAMQWRRNLRMWVRLLIHGEAHMLCEVVNMCGVPESMSTQELYSVMVQVYWQLRQRAWENMQLWLCRKDVSCIILNGRCRW